MKAAIFGLLAFTLFQCSSNNNTSNCSGWCNFALNAYTQLGTTFQIGTNPIPGYVTQPSAPLQIGQTITLNYTINGNGPYSIHDPADIPPASITLFVWERGDNLSGLNQYGDYRWWCDNRAVLQPGTNQVLTCKIDPAIWSNVGGVTALVTLPDGTTELNPGFQQALSNPYGVGFTFGGGYFFGHGVTDGNTTFTINSFTIQ